VHVDRYVDGACTNNGNGTAGDCASSGGGTGPYNSISNALSGAACDTTIHVRGVHTTHGSFHAGGTFIGSDLVYSNNVIDISGFTSCTALTPLIVQAHGWTANRARTEERTYIMSASAVTWTQCSDCTSSGQCANMPGTCGDTYYVDGSSPYAATISAVKSDKSMTWNAAQPSDLTNAHDSTAYNGATCSTDTWLRCYSDVDCPSGQTCSGSSAEIDSWQASGQCATATNQRCNCTNFVYPCSEGATQVPDCPGTEACNDATNRIYVKWGSGSAPSSTTPSVVNDAVGVGFRIRNSVHVIVRGFIGIIGNDHFSTVINSTGPVENISIIDNRISYYTDTGGSDYGIGMYACGDCTIAYNDIGFNGSEVHVEGKTGKCSITTTQACTCSDGSSTCTDGSGLQSPDCPGTESCSGANVATPVFIQHNWNHDNGDQKVRGNIVRGTPHGYILGEAGGGGGTGNFTGSILEGNLIQRMRNHAGLSAGMGIILENDSDGWIIRDNVFDSLDGPAIKFDAKGNNVLASTNNTEIYNNVFHDCALSPGGSTTACIHLFCNTTANELRDNKIYNNTFVTGAQAIRGECTSNSATYCSGNLVRNNVMDSTGNAKVVNWTVNADSTNLLDFNLIRTTANPAVTWPLSAAITNKACADIPDFGAGNRDNCPDPTFVSSTNFHIQTGSEAKDNGTTTGMPAGRTTDINNTLADDHGFVSYADNQAASGTVDIGADEIVVGSPVRRRPAVLN
jgi:hypothetical protein